MEVKIMSKTRGGGEHPNSLAARADDETAKKIRDGRRKAQQDLDAMEQWASSGFSASGNDDRSVDEIWDKDTNRA